jgi:hypothetical protein
MKDIAEYEETDSQLSKDTIFKLHNEIERLNKRNKEIYEGFMATTKELTEYAEENERLKDLCDKYEEEHRTTFEEWKKTINIINELEEILEYEKNDYGGNIDIETHNIDSEFLRGNSWEADYILNKLQKLKGSDKE